MKKSGVIFLLTVIVLVLVLLNGFVYVNADHTGPVIHIAASDSEYPRNVDAKTLLNGVTATDNRDGDVSSTLRVATIVPNSDNTKASVVYTAKDKSNNVSKLTRTITYSAENGDTTANGNASAAASASTPSSTDTTGSAAANSDDTAAQDMSPSTVNSVPATGDNTSIENN